MGNKPQTKGIDSLKKWNQVNSHKAMSFATLFDGLGITDQEFQAALKSLASQRQIRLVLWSGAQSDLVEIFPAHHHLMFRINDERKFFVDMPR